jgi:Na+/H+ antiporter NhaC
MGRRPYGDWGARPAGTDRPAPRFLEAKLRAGLAPMSDIAWWLILPLLALLGLAVTRFNPAIMYSRSTLFGLGVLAVVVLGAVLMLGFFGPPSQTLSGVYNPDGG